MAVLSGCKAMVTKTDFFNAMRPGSTNDIIDFVRNSAPGLVRVYDQKVLGGYDAGKELNYYLYNTGNFEWLCGKILTEMKAVALRRVMPSLPLCRLNTEMHHYALRNLFYSVMKGTAGLELSRLEGNIVPQMYFDKNAALMKEICVTMARLIAYAGRDMNGGNK